MLTMKSKKKINKRIVPVLLSFVTAVSGITLSAAIVFADEPLPPVRIVASSLGNHVSIHSDLQEQYLNGPLQGIADYAAGTEELSRPAKITLSWNTEIDEGFAAETGVSTEGCDYTLYFGKAGDFSDARTYHTAETSYQVTNLELDTTYYWKVASEIGGELYVRDRRRALRKRTRVVQNRAKRTAKSICERHYERARYRRIYNP